MGIDGIEIKKHRQKTERKTLKKNRYPTQWVIISIIIGVTLGYMLARFYQPTPINPQRIQKSVKVSFDGGAKKKLGNQGMELGLRDLSQKLIDFMNEKPKKTSYLITYTTAEDDRVEFVYDLKEQTLLWMLSSKGGRHPRLKVWTGNIQYRLIAASEGRSLNDTPDGKRLPTELQY
jgi:hypothetical protein